MSKFNEDAERRDRHSAEVEASQAELRSSIKETERLVDESDQMLRRHRAECEANDARARGPKKELTSRKVIGAHPI
jgi:hypothetical protein